MLSSLISNKNEKKKKISNSLIAKKKNIAYWVEDKYFPIWSKKKKNMKRDEAWNKKQKQKSNIKKKLWYCLREYKKSMVVDNINIWFQHSKTIKIEKKKNSIRYFIVIVYLFMAKYDRISGDRNLALVLLHW